ncbi:MAG: hypothetical protein MJ231_04875 [bacterium]|nr:hypothetical protein [bacterium]
MKNKFFTILIAVLLLMPTVAFAEEPIDEYVEETTGETVVTDTQPANLDEDNTTESVELQTQDVQEPYKKPISKRKIVKKFLLAMFGVGISSFLIFFGLSLYNKVRDRLLGQVKTPEGKTSLQTPDDLDGAVRTFLEKTDWK